MRVLNTLSFMEPIAGGGIMERVCQLSRYIIKKNHSCAVLTTSRGWDEEFMARIEGLEAVKMPCILKRFMVPIGTTRWFSSNIQRFDILHLAGNWSPINVRAYKAAKKYNTPYVFSAMGWLAIDGRSKLFKHIFRILWTRPMLRDAHAVVAISPREINDYIQFGVPRKKIYFIPNGIVTDELHCKDDNAFRKRYGMDNRKIILFIGRLNPIKGADLLIEAFSSITKDYDDYQLLVFGNDYGGFQAKLEKMVNALNLQHCVKILPPIYGVEKSWAYHAAELFVIPSRSDTMTIVALEAAACGCPVLLTENCDFPAISEYGGGLSMPCSVESIANGLRSILANSITLKQMGRKAREFVLANYHWDKISDDFIEMFQNILNSKQ